MASNQQPIVSLHPSYEYLYGNLYGHGPLNWGRHHPMALGTNQSPVDFQPSQVYYDDHLKNCELQFDYHPEDISVIKNTGSSFRLIAKEGSHPIFRAPGYLPDDYRLMFTRCHWGSQSHNGSEHSVAGRKYAAEIHLIHVNTKYPSVPEALKSHDGLATVAIFLDETRESNPALDPLVRLLQRIPFRDDLVEIKGGFDLRHLLPHQRGFWAYNGSMTTPPCTESVLWTVFNTPVPISSQQMSAFRHLYTVGPMESERNPQPLVNNVRPSQSLNGREVRATFRQ